MKRIYTSLLKEYLALFPCVAILGARQCGKTTMAHAIGEAWNYFDLENWADQNAIAPDPAHFLRLYPHQTVFDEAQLLPELFPALRVEIDRDRQKKGRFILTGSSSPDLLRNISESLAGRIGIIELAPFAWAEIHRGATSPLLQYLTVPLSAKLPAHLIEELLPNSDDSTITDLWFQGGYPEPWINQNSRFTERWMEQYTRTYLDRDIARLFPGLHREKFRLFIQLLAGLSGQILNYSETARALNVSQPTIRDYFEIAHGSFLWRKLPAYEKNSTKRIIKAPKGYLRDSGILHHLLRIPDRKALLCHPIVGRSWEGFVIEEILRQLNALGIGFDAYHYRTAAGAEVDLILEGRFGLLPIEIKRGQTIDGRNLRALKTFIMEHKCPFGLVINNDLRPRLYAENIIAIPFSCL